jgi:hypothetical protein
VRHVVEHERDVELAAIVLAAATGSVSARVRGMAAAFGMFAILGMK